MKKRAFVRYSKQGKIVPGSLILTSGSFPSGPSTWNEIPADLCCDSIDLTWDNGDVSLNNVSLRIKCNGTTVKEVFTNQNTTSSSSLESLLNMTFGLIGTFVVSGTLVTLTMTSAQKNAFCSSGIITFEIFED
jgi:hypothetical protein